MFKVWARAIRERLQKAGGVTVADVGRVKWFNDKKGYGFILREDGGEIFVHYSSIRMDGFKTLHENQSVQFEVMETPHGVQAGNVERVS